MKWESAIWYVVMAAASAAVLFVLLRHFRRGIDRDADEDDDAGAAKPDGRITSLVFLLRAPRSIDVAGIRAAAERAFGRKFGGDPTVDDSVVETGREGFIGVRTEGAFLGVMSVPGPYIENVADAADRQPVFLLKTALQQHRAWLAVDFVGELPEERVPDAFRLIGKLMAELAGPDCLALYDARDGGMNSYGQDLLPLLRGNNPRAALSEPRGDPTINAPTDDPRLAAAADEAKRRWPDFAAAFARRKPMQGFAVKSPMREGTAVEHMWIEVAEIDGELIRGRLANEPQLVRNVKLHDRVELRLGDIEDWLYSAGAQNAGGFSIRVLEDIAKGK